MKIVHLTLVPKREQTNQIQLSVLTVANIIN